MPPPTRLSDADIAAIRRELAAGEARTKVATKYRIGVTKLWKLINGNLPGVAGGGGSPDCVDEAPWTPGSGERSGDSNVSTDDLGLESAGRADAPLRVTKHFVCVPPPTGDERPGAELFGPKEETAARVEQLMSARAAGADDRQEQAALVRAIETAETRRDITPAQSSVLVKKAEEPRHEPAAEQPAAEQPAGGCVLLFE